MADFMAFSCKTESFPRSPEPALDGCPSNDPLKVISQRLFLAFIVL